MRGRIRSPRALSKSVNDSWTLPSSPSPSPVRSRAPKAIRYATVWLAVTSAVLVLMPTRSPVTLIEHTGNAGVATHPVLGATTAAAVGPVPHIMVIVEENQGYSQIIGNKAAPYINALARAHASATTWYGLTDTSLADYVALISGTTGSYSSPTLVGELATAGISWKAYMDSAPSACYTGGSVNGYTKTHNPFVHFKSITGTPAQCANVVPFKPAFATDFGSGGTAPSFAFVVPNQQHDMHSASVSAGDAWLKKNLAPVLPAYLAGGGIVIITWDSALTSDHSHWNTGSGGHVPTVVVSNANASRGALTSGGNQYGTLRAIEEAYIADGYQVPLLGASANSANGDLRPAFGKVPAFIITVALATRQVLAAFQAVISSDHGVGRNWSHLQTCDWPRI
jgi:phosphatidylinositol-3-phosphatase